MQYIDVFNAFYFGRNQSAFVGIKAKGKVRQFIMTAGLDDDHKQNIPINPNTYEKYDGNTKHPESKTWEIINQYFDEELFIKNISKSYNKNHTATTLRILDFPVTPTDHIDYNALFLALAKQFKAIANGDGSANNIFEKEYNCGQSKDTFPTYIQKLKTKYSNVNILFSEAVERPLEDVFVCNRLNTLSYAYMEGKGVTGEPIENANLDKLMAISSRIMLVGNCGMGKSMMLQHFLLVEIEKHFETGILPIFVELREFHFKKDLLINILDSIQNLDDSFTLEKLSELLNSGKCRLLMDGLDEVDPGDITEFQLQLSKIISKYPSNQYVITSRLCDELKSIKGFHRLYLMPFNDKQTEALIKKLLFVENVNHSPSDIINYLRKSFLKDHNIFATNPMLLTFIIQKYPIVETFSGQQHLFFQEAYDTILSGHDDEKEYYDRIFWSVKDPEEFTEVFQELCAKTYKDGVFKFTKASFKKYFKGLSSISDLSDPSNMKYSKFLHDACVTSCMMYQENTGIYYFDRGFQQYLFALFNYIDESDNVIKMGKALWKKSIDVFIEDTAFDMLYQMSPEKVEQCLFIPFLSKIYTSTDEIKNFINFIRMGYENIEYTIMDEKTATRYAKKLKASIVPHPATINQPSTILLSYISRLLGESADFQLEFSDKQLDFNSANKAIIVGEHNADKILLNKYSPHPFTHKDQFAEVQGLSNYIRAGTTLVTFGVDYAINTKSKDSEYMLCELSPKLKVNSAKPYKLFKQIELYYEKLTEKYEEKEWE